MLSEFNHPARSIKISNIFERAAMDIVLGFPESEEGFKGILVFTEYLTKFPHVYPIKSKSADEVASKLLDYISIYEPPKILISDQGKEFLNEVVSSLSKVAGVDRIIIIVSPTN